MQKKNPYLWQMQWSEQWAKLPSTPLEPDDEHQWVLETRSSQKPRQSWHMPHQYQNPTRAARLATATTSERGTVSNHVTFMLAVVTHILFARTVCNQMTLLVTVIAGILLLTVILNMTGFFAIMTNDLTLHSMMKLRFPSMNRKGSMRITGMNIELGLTPKTSFLTKELPKYLIHSLHIAMQKRCLNPFEIGSQIHQQTHILHARMITDDVSQRRTS
ncbi:unnamed protein product [Linum trigynum]|uniref:Uncharacterized protein n=1 Tax=Linum trigynum TaxID=586398 RepID=A0AAV2DY71_9ROSI